MLLAAACGAAPACATPTAAAQARYARTLETGGWVTSLSWSADGKLLASASNDGSARIWNSSGTQTQTVDFKAEGGVASVALSPDGRYLAAGGETGGVYIIRLADMAHAGALKLHNEPVKAVAWSPDSKFLASASLSGRVIIWDPVALKAVKSIAAHEGGATDVVFSPDGKYMVTTGNDQSARVWTLPDFRMFKALRGFNGNVNAAAFSPDSGHLALVSGDHLIQLWHTDTWKITLTVEHAHNCDINAVAYSPNGKLLATAGDDGFIKVWNTADMRRLRIIKNYNLDALSLAFAPDGRTLAAGYLLGTIRLWDWTRENACIVDAATVTDASGKTVGKLSKGKTAVIRWDKKTGAKIPVETDSLSGFVDRENLGFSGHFAPAIRLLSRNAKKDAVEIEGVAYDDCALVGLLVNGKKPSALKRKNDPGNYSDVFSFTTKTALHNGAASMEVSDCNGRRITETVSAEGKVIDWGPKLVEGRAGADAPLKDLPSADAPTLRMLHKGEPLVAIGYHKGYYLLQGGGWLNSDFVTGR
jgi:WD40 repeat protein